MNRIFEPETDFNSLEVFIVIFVLLLFRHIVFEFTVHTCMPNAWLCGAPERKRRCVRQQPFVTLRTLLANLGV